MGLAFSNSALASEPQTQHHTKRPSYPATLLVSRVPKTTALPASIKVARAAAGRAACERNSEWSGHRAGQALLGAA